MRVESSREQGLPFAEAFLDVKGEAATSNLAAVQNGSVVVG